MNLTTPEVGNRTLANPFFSRIRTEVDGLGRESKLELSHCSIVAEKECDIRSDALHYGTRSSPSANRIYLVDVR